VKIRRELKEKMEKYKDRVNWPDEVRRFIESRIRELEADENFERVFEELKKANWSVPRGFSASSVREDRDSSLCFSNNSFFPSRRGLGESKTIHEADNVSKPRGQRVL
jgi:hypothetical protein